MLIIVFYAISFIHTSNATSARKRKRINGRKKEMKTLRHVISNIRTSFHIYSARFILNIFEVGFICDERLSYWQFRSVELTTTTTESHYTLILSFTRLWSYLSSIPNDDKKMIP